MTRAPHPTRLDPGRRDYAAILAAHEAAETAGRHSYLDPSTGLVVQTRRAHEERGECCHSGCRHCPWVGVD